MTNAVARSPANAVIIIRARCSVPAASLFALEEGDMPSPTPEEKALMADTPRGTFVLMIVVAILLFAGWAALYFGRFLGNGPVH
jgi:hypothetical protein